MISELEILRAEVLVVDDQEVMACMLKEMLEQAGHTHVTCTRNLFQVMKELIAMDVNDYVPVLAITSESSYKLAALKAGAKDFISKPFLVDEALTRVRNMLEIRLLHEAARRALTTAEILSQQDPLTGLVNRRLVTRRIAAALANAPRRMRWRSFTSTCMDLSE